MWTFRTSLKTVVFTTRTLNEISLWPRKYINDQAKHAQKDDEDHPHHRVVHASRFRVSRNPNKQCNVQHNQRNDKDDYHYWKGGAASTGGTTASGSARLFRSATILRHREGGGEQQR